MKFGGTSVGDAQAIARLIAVVRDAPADQKVVVVSAMAGVTDQLQEGMLLSATGAPEQARSLAHDLLSRHTATVKELALRDGKALIEEIESLLQGYLTLCESVAVLGETTPRALDHAMSLGERLSARLVAAALQTEGVESQAVEATRLIVTDDRFGNAAPLLEPSRARLQRHLAPTLEAGTVPVVTGFLGATREGVTTTLGRGGSDYSAALIGALLECDEVWIWTDVDGVMSADPRLVPDARSIRVLSYREVSELAYFGARVLHPKTIRPVMEAGIPLRVKNTFNPDHPGTLVVPQHQQNGGAVKAVTAIPEVSLITVEGKGMLGVPGIAARTFGAVARTGTSVLLISQASSEQSICFAVPRASGASAVEALNREFASELARRDIDRVWAQEPITIVTVVGAGMRATPGVAGKVFSATGARGINVLAIAQGSSECSISLAVEARQGVETLHALHALTQKT